jgi:hypothetical protein
MHFFNPSFRNVSLLAIAGSLQLACSSDEGGENTGPQQGAGGGGSTVACATNDLPLSFTPMYSAYGGTHTYKVPAIANGVSGAAVEWSASDPTMVDIVPDDTTGGVMITTKKAGAVTIKAQAGTRCGSSELTITAVTDAQWDAGNARYNNSNPLKRIELGCNGIPNVPLTGGNPLVVEGAPPACTNCHGELASSDFLSTGISHTPQQTGGFSDAELKAVFTEGVIPEGGYYDADIIPKVIWNFFHKWTDVTPEQADGLVAYLRSLTPKSQGGMIDFGGLTRPGGGSGSGGNGAVAPPPACGGAATSAGGAAAAAGGATGAGGASAAGGTSG